MDKNILNPETRESILRRVSKLKNESKGNWGVLTAVQMVRHLTEAARMALDEIPMPDRSNFISRSLFKWLFLHKQMLPPGREKGNVKTFPEVDVVALNLEIGDLEKEKTKYYSVLDRIVTSEELARRHTVFGNMSCEDWGSLCFYHANYHLTQFNM